MAKGGGGSQKSTGTQTVTTEPAKFVAPYYSQAAKESQNLYNTYRPEYFTGSTFVPYSPETETALQAQTQRAMSGSPLTGAAQEQQLATIRGDYLTGSPALQQELDRIKGQVGAQFAGGGGYRSSANQEVLAREMGNAAVRNYANERNIQQQSALASPALAAQDYADIAALGDVGTKREDLFGRQLQDQMNRFNFMQEQDPAALDEYIKRITALGGGMGTQTSTGTQPSIGGSALTKGISGLQSGLGVAGALGSLGSTSPLLGGVVGSMGPVQPFAPALGGPVGLGIAGLGLLGGLFS